MTFIQYIDEINKMNIQFLARRLSAISFIALVSLCGSTSAAAGDDLVVFTSWVARRFAP